jgi:hypothetical protein
VSVPDPVTTGLVTAGLLQVGKQAQDFIAAALGHPGESIGTIVGNIARRRSENIDAVGNQAHLILLNLGVQPTEVPLPILYPALESASLQEDPDLRAVWANLLANAADPRHMKPVSAQFPSILKDLGVREVKFLDHLFAKAEAEPVTPTVRIPQQVEFSRDGLLMAYTEAGLSRQPTLIGLTARNWRDHKADLEADFRDFDFTLSVVKRQLLIDESVSSIPQKKHQVETETKLKHVYAFTQLGISFIEACRPPRAK